MFFMFSKNKLTQHESETINDQKNHPIIKKKKNHHAGVLPTNLHWNENEKKNLHRKQRGEKKERIFSAVVHHFVQRTIEHQRTKDNGEPQHVMKGRIALHGCSNEREKRSVRHAWKGSWIDLDVVDYQRRGQARRGHRRVIRMYVYGVGPPLFFAQPGRGLNYAAPRLRAFDLRGRTGRFCLSEWRTFDPGSYLFSFHLTLLSNPFFLIFSFFSLFCFFLFFFFF